MSGFVPHAGRLLMSGAAGAIVGYAAWSVESTVVSPNTFPLWWFVAPAILVGIATWLGFALAPRGDDATGGWSWRHIGVMALKSAGAIAAIGLVCGGAAEQALRHPRELGAASPILAPIALGVAFVCAAFAAGRLTGLISATAGVVPGVLSSLLGVGLAVFCGLVCGAGIGLVFAVTYVDPCDIPGRHLYCLDLGRWGLFPGIVVAGLVLGAWVSAAVGLTLIALSLSVKSRRGHAGMMGRPQADLSQASTDSMTAEG